MTQAIFQDFEQHLAENFITRDGAENASDAGQDGSIDGSDTTVDTPSLLEPDLDSATSSASLTDIDITFTGHEPAPGDTWGIGEPFDGQLEGVGGSFDSIHTSRLSGYILGLQDIIASTSHIEEAAGTPIALWLSDTSDAYILRLNHLRNDTEIGARRCG